MKMRQTHLGTTPSGKKVYLEKLPSDYPRFSADDHAYAAVLHGANRTRGGAVAELHRLASKDRKRGGHTAHATKSRSVWPSVIGSHGLGTADVRTSEGAYWIVTRPTGYRVDYKPWGPSNEIDLGTFASRKQARSEITKHARASGGKIRSHATKRAIPGVTKWNTYAGGTGAAEGKHSYDLYVPEGQYTISPFNYPRSPRHAGYMLKFAATGGRPRGGSGGLWHDLGSHSSPQKAASAAAAHYAKGFE